MKGLRFYTFRNEYDLKELKEKGRITVPYNFCENYMFDVISAYTGIEGIVWFWACYGDLELEGYLGYRYIIEFKEPKDYILLTPERFEYIDKDILDKYDEQMRKCNSAIEGYTWLLENTDFKSYLKDFKPSIDEQHGFNPRGALKQSNLYMGIMTELKSEDIISITDLDENTNEMNYF